jgi:hypothetical protein
MQIDTRLGTFDEVAEAVPAQSATLRAVRALVAEVFPDCHEVAARRECSVWWGWGSAKMKQGFAWAMPHRAHVNFGFFLGTSLPDPEARLEGTGKALRHVKLTSPEAAADPAVRALLLAAGAERRATLAL